jgi:hypothetical protein
MATAFKPFWEVGEAKALQKGIAIGEAKAQQREQEMKRRTIISLIKTTQLENIQIAEAVDAPIVLVETIRLELKKAR